MFRWKSYKNRIGKTHNNTYDKKKQEYYIVLFVVFLHVKEKTSMEEQNIN